MTVATGTGLKFRVKRTVLVKTVKALVGAVSKKAMIPVLAAILFKSDERGILTATATDMEVMVRIPVEAEVLSQGAIVIPVKQLAMVAEFSTGDEISVSVNQRDLTASFLTDTDELVIHSFSPDQFPDMLADFSPFFSIERADLLEMTNGVLVTCGKDESKPWLEHPLIRVGESLFAMSTDGVRIGWWEKPVTVHTTGQALIVRQALQMAAKLAAPGETVQVGIRSNQLKFTGHDFEVVGRILDQKYPEVLNLVPSEYTDTAVTDRDHLMSALRLATGWSKDGACKLSTDGDMLLAEENLPEYGRFLRRIPATASAEFPSFGFNSRLLLPVLKQFRGPEITIHASGNRNPAKFTCSDQPHLKYVVLPLITF